MPTMPMPKKTKAELREEFRRQARLAGPPPVSMLASKLPAAFTVVMSPDMTSHGLALVNRLEPLASRWPSSMASPVVTDGALSEHLHPNEERRAWVDRGVRAMPAATGLLYELVLGENARAWQAPQAHENVFRGQLTLAKMMPEWPVQMTVGAPVP
jgi:hypothetical protein